ncbi:MAG: AarF/ABC1/UbiB kinase family protein [Candidatus Woesearchaeota archaeon]
MSKHTDFYMFGRTSKIENLKRLKQIANTLLKVGLGYFIERMRLKSYVSFHKKIDQSKFEKPINSLPSRLRIAFDSLGGSFIKLGQMLSLRYDILPKEYCDEFSKLQDDVKPVPFSSIRAVIEEELGVPLAQVFKSFDTKPIAAASIGQVHKAVLKNGTVVAVKVQRPGVEHIFQTDIELYYYLADLLVKHVPEVRDYEPKSIVEEFQKYTNKEMDYTLEAKNIDIFHNNFKNSIKVKIPKVYWEYTKKRVLVMEFIEGKKINEVKHFSQLRSSRKKIVENVIDAVMKQIFEHKIFHADPHPGNIFLIKDNVIAFLDFGIVGRITKDMENELEDFLIGIVNHDVDMLARSLVESGSMPETVDMKAFKGDLVDTLGGYYDTSISQLNLAGMFLAVFKLSRQYHIKLPMNYTLLGKTFITLEGFSTKFYPEFNFVRYMKPKLEKMISERMGPRHILSSVKDTAMDIRAMIKSFPSDVGALVRAIKYGTKIQLEVDQKELKNFTLEMDRSSDRLTSGMILAALILAAALIIKLDVGPFIYGISFLVYIVLLFIIIISLSLIVSILREGKRGEEE